MSELLDGQQFSQTNARHWPVVQLRLVGEGVGG